MYGNSKTDTLQFWEQSWDGGVWGDKSWTAEHSFGTAENVFIEDCLFENTTTINTAITDSYAGHRLVIRFCTFINYRIASHGTGDGSGRNRSGVHWEIYGNTFTQTPATSANVEHHRGGSVIRFMNTVNGHSKGSTLHNYRGPRS